MERIKKARCRAGSYPVRSITKRNVLVKRVAIRAEKSQLRQ